VIVHSFVSSAKAAARNDLAAKLAASAQYRAGVLAAAFAKKTKL